MKTFAILTPQNPTGLICRAVEILSSTLLDYTVAYPVCCTEGTLSEPADFHCIHIGTKQTNDYIRTHSAAKLTLPEEYAIAVSDSTVMIEGYDDAGVLYGAIDFYREYLMSCEYPSDARIHRHDILSSDTLPACFLQSAPAVRERGLWTWGHVIYDYRGYLDNMMMLKMNCVIIWNDFLPSNAREIIAYAHARNIRVIWGFAWLWDTDCAKFDMHTLRDQSAGILEKFEREFAGIDVDGIYFQTFTELGTDNINGVLIAEAAADFVNHTAEMFYRRWPEMEIQFGLHAESVRSRLEFLRRVDPRIRIVWENCGAFPFSYQPNQVAGFDETAAFVREIAHLRGEGERFGAVTKGLVNLDWSQFVHSRGSHCIGVSNARFKHNRVDRKAPIWKFVQASWIANADYAQEMIRIMADETGGDLCICGLLEDGMFEDGIQYPTALFARMLWNCREDIRKTRFCAALGYDTVFA